MSAAIIIAILVGISVIAIKSYAKKLIFRCCGGEVEKTKK